MPREIFPPEYLYDRLPTYCRVKAAQVDLRLTYLWIAWILMALAAGIGIYNPQHDSGAICAILSPVFVGAGWLHGRSRRRAALAFDMRAIADASAQSSRQRS